MKTMSYLIRMVDPMKAWSQTLEEIGNGQLIYADAISDLKTNDNTLSTWHVENCSDSEINKVVIALSSTFRSLDSMRIVYIDYSNITEQGFNIKKTLGDSKIESYNNMHRDIAELNAGMLQKFAVVVLESILAENVKTISKNDVGMLLYEALNENILK